MGIEERLFHKAKTVLDQADNVVVLTGAGISAESGVPTFRGEDGLWRSYKAEELATPEAFRRNPELVWEWYNWRRRLISETEPNAGHLSLVALERSKRHFALVTQNVDGLHRKAGSLRVFEIHGNIWTVRCSRCDIEMENNDVPLSGLPLCPACNALQRPGVVWFGETLPPYLISAVFKALECCDVFMTVGTSGMVYPAASFAAEARRSGAFVLEVNLEPTPNSRHADLSLFGKAGEILPKLIPNISGVPTG